MLPNFMLLLAGLVSTADAPPQSVVTELGAFADTYQFATAPGEFRVSNNTDRELTISINPARHTDHVVSAPSTLAPHASAVVKVTVTPQFESGIHLHGFAVAVKGEKEVLAYGQVRGFVQSLLNDTTPLHDFGVVDARATELPKANISLASDEVPDLRATKIIEKPEFVDATIAADGRSVAVTLKEDNEWGLKDGFVKVALSDAKQPAAWLEVRADLHGDVIPFSNPFGFGVARKGQNNTYLIRLDHREGKKFSVGTPRLEGFKGLVDVQPCVPVKDGCQLLKLVLSDDQPTGKLNGRLIVPLPELSRTLFITVWGMLFKADAAIADLASSTPAPGTKVQDIAAALRSATDSGPAPIVMPAPEGDGPLLKWTLQNELQTYGYVIYRADSETGALHRINDQIIRAVSGADNVTVEYRWRDTSARPGHTYWYQIATVNLRGMRTNLTGRVKKTYMAPGKPQ